jgi:hypothetical protein
MRSVGGTIAMTAYEYKKFTVWQRWLRITRRKTVANVSADLRLRSIEQPSMADSIDVMEKVLTAKNN